MNDEVIWRTSTPYHIRIFVWLGALVSFICAGLYLLVFAITLYLLPSALRTKTPFEFSIPGILDSPVSIDLIHSFKYILIICGIACLFHFVCGYGTYKTRTIKFPAILIAVYILLTTKVSILTTPGSSFIFFIMMVSWGIALYGCVRFYNIKKGYIELHKAQNIDPYGLHSTYADTDSSIKTGGYLPPKETVKVEVKPSQPEKDEDDEDSSPKSYF